MDTRSAAEAYASAADLSVWGADLVSERPELLQRNGTRFALAGVHVSHPGRELGAPVTEEDKTSGDDYGPQHANDDGSDKSLQGCGERLWVCARARTVPLTIPTGRRSGRRPHAQYTPQIPGDDRRGV